MANIIQNHIKGFLSSLVTPVMLEILLLKHFKNVKEHTFYML